MFRVCPAGRTPLTAAFFCLAGLLGGCQSAGILTELPPDACNGPVTPIASIQGDGTSSPVVGKQLQIRGVVTLTRPGSGLFLQEPLSDLSPLTSDGLFVDNAQLARLANEFAVIRSMNSREGSHERATYLIHTSYPPLPGIEHPSMGAWSVSLAGQRSEEIPNYVVVGSSSRLICPVIFIISRATRFGSSLSVAKSMPSRLSDPT